MVFGLFSKGFDADLFERELTGLTDQISSTQQQVNRLRKHWSHFRNALIRYLILGFLLLNVYNYSQLPRGIEGRNRFQKYIKGQSGRQLLMLVGYPLSGYAIVYLVGLVYQVLIKSRESKLVQLRKKHTAKIEELKKVTNFHATNRLLTKYGSESPKSTPEPIPNPNAGAQSIPAGSKAEYDKLTPKQKKVIGDLNLSSPKPEQPQKSNASGVVAAKRGPRTLQDRILDYLVGSNNSESIEDRYALICVRCSKHNGLAPPNCADPSRVKYSCWKCGFMNGQWDLQDLISEENVNENDNVTGNVTDVKEPRKGNSDAGARRGGRDRRKGVRSSEMSEVSED